MLSISTIFIIGAVYIAVFLGIFLFFFKSKLCPDLEKIPIIYVTSLASSFGMWGLFGSVGMAYDFGNVFLAYYFLCFLLFMLFINHMKPLVKITQIWQLKSIADLLSFRFYSPFVGRLTTVVIVVAIMPLMALQIKAMTSVIGIIVYEDQLRDSNFIGFIFSVVVCLFSMIIGIRKTKEINNGFISVIAGQSLLKVVCVFIISAVILFKLFKNPAALSYWVMSNKEMLIGSDTDFLSSWKAMLIIFFTSLFAMPHMYHVIFSMSYKLERLNKSIWVITPFLIIINLTTPLIFWGSSFISMQDLNWPEYAVILISDFLNLKFLQVIIYIGALAASVCFLSITANSLSSMIISYFILPVFNLPEKITLYRWLNLSQQFFIMIIIVLSYTFFVFLSDHTNLTAMARVSASAVVQFLPAIFSVCFWFEANKKGFIAGLIGGISIWIILILIPFFAHDKFIHFDWIDVYIHESNFVYYTLIAFAVNCLLFLLVSKTTSRSNQEKQRAILCSVDPMKQGMLSISSKASLPDLEKKLQAFIGLPAARKEVSRALYDVAPSQYDEKQFPIHKFRQKLEANLCGLLGVTVTQAIMDACFPNNDTEINQDFYYLESRLGNYRYKVTGLAAELDQLRQFHQITLGNLPIALCLLSCKNKIMMWNRSMERLTGIRANDIKGLNTSNLISPWREVITEFLADELKHQPKLFLEINQEKRWFNFKKEIIKIPGGLVQSKYKKRTFTLRDSNRENTIILVEDVTDMVKLEEKLVHRERLASIGQLASGVAHEIGNPVTGIDCLAQELSEFSHEKNTQKIAFQILEQTKRISYILQTLVNFSHSGENYSSKMVKNCVNIRKCVEGAIALLSLNPENRKMDFSNYCSHDHTIFGDETKVIQIFLNLLKNSRDSCESNNTNKITIKSAYYHKEIRIKVIDNGSGISPTVQKNLFEPFVTTKEVGQGTGLGLSFVYSLVKEHQGNINVFSPIFYNADKNVKEGCCFELRFPAYVSKGKSPLYTIKNKDTKYIARTKNSMYK